MSVIPIKYVYTNGQSICLKLLQNLEVPKGVDSYLSPPNISVCAKNHQHLLSIIKEFYFNFMLQSK